MFTGIVETLGKIKSIETDKENLHFEVESNFNDAVTVDQSIAHDGVCLTVTEVLDTTYKVTAIKETLEKTGLKHWKPGSKVNLERCMVANGRFDGHVVQGHVDQTGKVQSITDLNGSWEIAIQYDAGLGNVTVEKGSITLNGISLTCFNSEENSFSVAIIPYTFEHTNVHAWNVGDVVNLEFDIIGKYVKRLMRL